MTVDSKGNIKFIEVKNGPNARLTPNQKKLQDALNNGEDVIPRGKNAAKAGLKPGEPVGAEFQVDRWQKGTP